MTLMASSEGAREVRDPEGLLHTAGSGEMRHVVWNPQLDPWALRLEDRGPADGGTDLDPPALWSESTQALGPTKRMVLRAQSKRGSSHLILRELTGANVRVISVNAEPVGEIVRFSPSIDRWMWLHLSGDRDSWRLQFAGLPPGGVRVEIEVPETSTPMFEVRDERSEQEPSATPSGIAASFSRVVVKP
jgi:hypothetical protein